MKVVVQCENYQWWSLSDELFSSGSTKKMRSFKQRNQSIASGDLLHSYWTWPIYRLFALTCLWNMVTFNSYVKWPEGIHIHNIHIISISWPAGTPGVEGQGRWEVRGDQGQGFRTPRGRGFSKTAVPMMGIWIVMGLSWVWIFGYIYIYHGLSWVWILGYIYIYIYLGMIAKSWSLDCNFVKHSHGLSS